MGMGAEAGDEADRARTGVRAGLLQQRAHIEVDDDIVGTGMSFPTGRIRIETLAAAFSSPLSGR
jgi:hypothetical protein